MPKFKPPKPTLTASPVLSVEDQRKAMWARWIDDCDYMRDVFNEGLLARIPSREAKDE